MNTVGIFPRFSSADELIIQDISIDYLKKENSNFERTLKSLAGKCFMPLKAMEVVLRV